MIAQCLKSIAKSHSKKEGDTMNEDLLNATRLVPCSAVLVSVETEGRQDAMTATAMFVSEDPPLFTVSLAKHILSHELMERAGQFALNVTSTDQVELAKQLGYTHGKDVDKFEKFGISTEKSTKITAPLIQGSYANIECKVINSFSAINYTVFLAEVVAYKVDENLIPMAWHSNKYFALNNELK
jgi:flavin reductase (DIM6/NTAB) family NADH-FMN oxidoreductase RutF